MLVFNVLILRLDINEMGDGMEMKITLEILLQSISVFFCVLWTFVSLIVILLSAGSDHKFAAASHCEHLKDCLVPVNWYSYFNAE